MEIIGYTYNADYHCKDCTREYIYNITNPTMHVYVRMWLLDGSGPEHFKKMLVDSESNPIYRVFDTDEWYVNDIYEGHMEATLSCGDCGAELAVWRYYEFAN